MLTLGSLFDGIGGFPLAAVRSATALLAAGGGVVPARRFAPAGCYTSVKTL